MKSLSDMSASEMHEYLAETDISLGQVIDVLNDIAAMVSKYEGQEDAAEIVIHHIVSALVKDVPMSPLTKAATLSALGYSQNAFGIL